jgi:quercetin dioxygenase-like cupin family protein
MKRYSFVAPDCGPNYAWAQDHTFVKVTTADSGGAFTLMEDNLKAEFALGLHVHHAHAETFYILDGAVDFYIDGDWMTATKGTTVHIPPGVPHAVTTEGRTAKMLMIFQPSGFDQYLAELAAMDETDFADAGKMEALALKHDIVNLGPVPAR